MPTAVLFDYDGTLLDSIGEVYRGVCNVFRMSGLSEPSIEVFFSTFELPYATFYRKHGVTAPEEDIVRWYFEVARHEEQFFFFDVVDAVNILAQCGVLMGIISAHHEDKIVTRCEEAGIHKHMQLVVGRVNVKVDSIQKFCREYSVSPFETYYVGDLISDVRDAKRAGVIAVGITRGRGTREVLELNGADHCISNLHELLHLL
ncbi:MAG: HAD family hydrolase [Patescibacteria group bacterium]